MKTAVPVSISSVLWDLIEPSKTFIKMKFKLINVSIKIGYILILQMTSFNFFFFNIHSLTLTFF